MMQTADLGERNNIACGGVCKTAYIGTRLDPSSEFRSSAVREISY
jgi:hypothetical protein